MNILIFGYISVGIFIFAMIIAFGVNCNEKQEEIEPCHSCGLGHLKSELVVVNVKLATGRVCKRCRNSMFTSYNKTLK